MDKEFKIKNMYSNYNSNSNNIDSTLDNVNKRIEQLEEDRFYKKNDNDTILEIIFQR